MRKVYLLLGIALLIVSVFAEQIGIDNDKGWGSSRIIILVLGLVVILAGLLIIFFRDKLIEFKKHSTVFSKKYLSFSYSTQTTLVSFIAIILVVFVYFWFAQPFAKDARHKYNYYSELAISFKAGHLYLTKEPSNELLLFENPYSYVLRKQYGLEDFPWDVSLYNQKFYIYWGPVPSLILTMVSNEQLSRIGDHYLALAFACGLFLYATLIVANFWYKSLKPMPIWLLGMSLLVIGLSTPVTIMLKESRIYEGAILGCQFFFIGGCYWAYCSIGNHKVVVWELVLAGIHWALALGTRITILPVVLFLITVTIVYKLKAFKTTASKFHLHIFAVMGIPTLLVLSGLFWYNWARFGSIFEFGLKYQLTNVDYNVFKDSFSSRYIIGNIYNYFFYPIQVRPIFPYITRVEYLLSNERLAGLLYISPYIALLFAPAIRMFGNSQSVKKSSGAQQTEDSSWNWLIIAFASSALITIAIVLSFYFVTMRYIEDFMPSLILLITIQVGREYQLLNQNNVSGKALKLITIALAMVTITANILVAMPRSDIAFVVNLLNSIGEILGLRSR